MAILGPDGLPYRNGEIAADDGIAVVKDRNWDRPYDDFALPHVTTFSAVIQGASRTYYHLWDEAMRHNRENALAMRRDPHLLRLLEERKRSLVKLKWHLKPDNEKDRWQKMVADALTRYIQAIPRFRRIRRQLLNATWYGRYGVQVKWEWQWDNELNQRHLQVLDHLPVNGDKINYGLDHTPYVLIYGAAESMLPGAEVENTTLGRAIRLVGAWRDRFIIHTYDPDDADYFDAEMAAGVHGVGVRSRIYWHHWLRNEYISWVTDSLERIGLGIVVVEYDQSNAQAKSEAMAVAKAISKKTVVVVPALKSGGSSAGAVKVVEMPLGGAEVCLKLQQAADDYLEKYLIGQMLSSDHRGSGGLGGGGAASFQKDTKYDIIADDAVDLDETLTGSAREMGLVHFIKKHTFPWADFPVRYVTDVPDPDSEKKLESINKAFSMGAGFVESEVTGLVGMSTPGPTDKVLSTKVQAEEALEVQKKAEGSQQPGQPGQQPRESEELQGDPEFDALQGDHEPQGQLASAGGNISLTDPQRSPVVQQRLEGEVLRYRAESGGRWLTIGARNGKGTHVFIENGRITKGHPRLLGKKISALGDLPDHRASWDKAYRRSRDLQARESQVNPRELHSLAGEMLAHDKATVADELRFRRRANDLSIRNGFGSVQNLAHRAAGGKLDQASIRNFDVLTTAVYGEFPEYFAGVDEQDRPGKLFEMLTKPRPEPMQEHDAYNNALEQLKAEYASVPFELRGWVMRYYDNPGSSSGPIHYIDQPTSTSESGGGSGASAGGMAGTPEGAGSRSGHNPLMPSLPGQATRPPGSLLPPASSGKVSPSGTHGLHEKVAKALTEPPQPGAFGEHLGIKNGPHVSDLLLNKETPFHQATAEDHAATLKALEEFRQTPSKSWKLFGKLARSAPGPMATPEEQRSHDVRMNLMEQHLQSLPLGKPGRLTKANAAHAFYVEGLEHAPPEQAQRTQQLLSKLPFTDVATTDPRTGVTTQGRVYLPPAGFEARQAFSHLPGQVNRYKDFLSPETQQQLGAAQPSLSPTAQTVRPTAQPTAQAVATPSQPTGITLADFDQEPGQAGAVKQKQVGMAAMTFQLTPEGDLDLHSLKAPQGYEGHARSAMQQLLGRVDEIGGMKVHVQPSPEQVDFYKGLGFKTVATVGGRPIMTREPQLPQRQATTPAEQPRTERPPSFELPDVGQPAEKTPAEVLGGEQGRPAMGNPEENRFLEQRTRSAQGREARGGTPWVEHFFNALAKNPGPAASRPAVAEKPIDPTDMQAIEDFLLQEGPDKPIPTYEEISSWLQQSHFTPEQVHAAVQEANKAHREDSAKPQQAHDVGFGVNEAQLLAGHAGQAMEEGHPTPLHLTPEAVQRLHSQFGQSGDPTAPPLQHPPAKPMQAPGTPTPSEVVAQRAKDKLWDRIKPGKQYYPPKSGGFRAMEGSPKEPWQMTQEEHAQAAPFVHYTNDIEKINKEGLKPGDGAFGPGTIYAAAKDDPEQGMWALRGNRGVPLSIRPEAKVVRTESEADLDKLANLMGFDKWSRAEQVLNGMNTAAATAAKQKLLDAGIDVIDNRFDMDEYTPAQVAILNPKMAVHHREEVRAAAASGKQVPPEVSAAYPEFAKEMKQDRVIPEPVQRYLDRVQQMPEHGQLAAAKQHLASVKDEYRKAIHSDNDAEIQRVRQIYGVSQQQHDELEKRIVDGQRRSLVEHFGQPGRKFLEVSVVNPDKRGLLGGFGKGAKNLQEATARAQTTIDGLFNPEKHGNVDRKVVVEQAPGLNFYVPKEEGTSATIMSSHNAIDWQVAHELGHHLEHESPLIRQAVAAFSAKRFGNEPFIDIREKFDNGTNTIPGGIKGRKDEMDELFAGNEERAYYVGRVYPDGETEVLSIGLELLQKDPVFFARTDPEYFHFVISALRGDYA